MKLYLNFIHKEIQLLYQMVLYLIILPNISVGPFRCAGTRRFGSPATNFEITEWKFVFVFLFVACSI